MTARQADWPYVLNARIRRDRDVPFAWGTNDCFLWACDVVHAITGHDPGAELRGTYSSYREALTVAHKVGGEDFLSAFRIQLQEYPEIPTWFASRGDLVATPLGRTNAALCVCLGAVVVSPGRYGLIYQPIRNGIFAWSVGHG
jgi:hypothetical protein